MGRNNPLIDRTKAREVHRAFVGRGRPRKKVVEPSNGARFAALVARMRPAHPPSGTGATIPPPVRKAVRRAFAGRVFGFRGSETETP